jgi:hypothetical protein
LNDDLADGCRIVRGGESNLAIHLKTPILVSLPKPFSPILCS